MPVLNERVETTLPIDRTYEFVADFANSSEWDPGVATSERLDEGPPGGGALYALGVRVGGRVLPMHYRVTHFEPPHRVVLVGAGSRVAAVDDIRFEQTESGTTVDYTADSRLVGVLRMIEPLLGRAFRAIGRNAAAGMHRALAEPASCLCCARTRVRGSWL